MMSDKFSEISQGIADLLENIPDTVIITDLDGNVVHWNKGATEVFGYEEKEILGSKIKRLYAPEELEKIKVFRDSVLKGERITNIEITEVSKDGKPVQVLLSIIPLRDDSGRISWLAGIGKDITDIKRMQEKLLESEKLETAHNMIVTLNHEMNQPLTCVYSYVQSILEDTRKNKAAKLEYVERLKQQCERLSELLRKISQIRQIKTTDYIKGTKMLDLDKSTDLSGGQ